MCWACLNCVALYFGCIDEDNPDTDASTVWLMALILQIGFCFFNNELIWYLSGVGEYRQFYLFLNCLSDIYDQLLVSLFYNYVRRMLNFKGRLSRWLDRYIFILLIPIFILIKTIDLDGRQMDYLHFGNSEGKKLIILPGLSL